MLYVTFSESLSSLLISPFTLADRILPEDIIILFDDMSFGQIAECQSYESRAKYSKYIFSDDEQNRVKAKCNEFAAKLRTADEVTIFYSQHPTEQSDFLYTVWYVQNYNQKGQCKIYVADCTKFVEQSNQLERVDIPSLIENKYLLTDIACIEFSKYWISLMSQNANVRTFNGSKIVSTQEDYLDSQIIQLTKKCKDKSTLLGKLLNKYHGNISYGFLTYRIDALTQKRLIKLK